eukprot:TRINITY_DN36692_c0_g1_i1.p1 TRINITY_DN36692_c0_g1~~TRINITY_DN36692_c0_g1_i1.p1  ORF type:complete len:728 (-),score=60.83 TRINITY_DN36692_c0_g1_i1:266-2449(-)
MEFLKDGTIHDSISLVAIAFVWIVAGCLVDYSSLASVCKGCVQRCCRSRDEETERLLMRWRWTYTLQVNTGACCLLFLRSVAVFVGILLSATRWATVAQDYTFCVAFCGVVLIHFFAEAARRQFEGWDLGHAYYMFTTITMVAWILSAHRDHIYDSDLCVMPLRIPLGMMPLKRKYLLAGNLLYDGAAVMRIMLAQSHSCGPSNFLGALLMHAGMTPSLMLSSLIVEKLLMAEKKADENVTIMHSAARRLLDLLADVVLELGQDLCLVVDAPKLSAMLFLNGRGSLAGVRLTGFMTESNDQRFSEILGGVGAGHGPDVGALNVTLMDSIGHPLHLEAFYIYIAAAGMKTRYLIGLRENCQREDRFGSLPSLGALPATPDVPDLEMNGDWIEVHDNSSATSSLASSAGSIVQCAVADRLITTHGAKQTMINDLLKRCSFNRQSSHPFGYCCEKHQAVKGMLKHITTWQHEPCDFVSFSHHSRWQCSDCGIMDHRELADSRCQSCRSQDSLSCAETAEQPTLPKAAATLPRSLHQAITPAKAVDTVVMAEAACMEQKSQKMSSSSPGESDGGGVCPATPDDARHAHVNVQCDCRSQDEVALADQVHSLPHLSPTHPQAVRRLAEEILKSWNFVVSRSDRQTQGCCRRHVAVEHLLTLLGQMQRQPCEPAFVPYNSWQCSMCGVLDIAGPADGRCTLCILPEVYGRAEAPETHFRPPDYQVKNRLSTVDL